MPEETTDDNVVRLKIDGDTFDVDIDDLELGEIGEVEDLCDENYREIDWDSARGMQGLAWIALHRRDPRFTMADAGRIKIGKFSFADDAEADTSGSDKAKTARPTKTT